MIVASFIVLTIKPISVDLDFFNHSPDAVNNEQRQAILATQMIFIAS